MVALRENRFRVEYRVVLAQMISGETIGIKEEFHLCHTTSNDSNVVFTDLFMQYRHQGILGLEILQILPISAIKEDLLVSSKIQSSIS